MGNYLTFLGKQGLHNIRRSFLILVGISLSISMIAGVNYYVEAAQHRYLQNEFYFLGDLHIYNYDDNLQYLGPQYFSQLRAADEFAQRGDFGYSDQYFYEFHEFPQLVIYKNYTAFPDQYDPDLNIFEYIRVNLMIMEFDFYNSSRFSEFFNIVKGRIPQNNQELLIDYNTYQRLSLPVGEPINLTTRFWYEVSAYDPETSAVNRAHPIMDYIVPNITISGVYLPIKEKLQIRHMQYQSPLSDYVDQPIGGIPLMEQEHLPIFSGSIFNKTFDTNNNPYHALLNQIDYDVTVEMGRNPIHMLVQNFGIYYNYERDIVNPNRLRSLISESNRDTEDLEFQIELYLNYQYNYDLRVYNNLAFLLENVFDKFDSIRFQLQLFNVPIFIFAIAIGNSALKTKIKGRKEELLLLRSKGLNTFMINMLVLVEALFSSIFISILGTFGGSGFFYSFHSYLSNFLGLESMGGLNILISWRSLLFNFGVSFALIIFSSLTVIIYVNKMHSEKILKSLGSDDMDVLYDEKSLYKSGKENPEDAENSDELESDSDQNKIHEQSENLNSDQMQKLQNRNTSSSDSLPQNMNEYYNQIRAKHTDSVDFTASVQNLKQDIELKKLKKAKQQINYAQSEITIEDMKLYEDIVENKEKKIPLSTIIFIIIGILPVIPYILISFYRVLDTNDTFSGIALFILRYSNIFEFITILTPIFIPIGLLRLLLLNKPTKLAKVSKNISEFILKTKSFLCGMEIVRRKQFKYLIILLTLFVGSLSFANIYSITSINEDVAIENIDVGTDVHAYPLKGNNPVNLTNLGSYYQYRSHILNYPIPDNVFRINDVQVVFREVIPPTETNVNFDSYYLNLSSYTQMILEKGKFIPDNRLENQLKIIENYNSETAGNTLPSVIINQKLAETNYLRVGSIFNFEHSYYNSSSESSETQNLEVRIGAILNYMPGLFSDLSSDKAYMVVDSKFINNKPEILPSPIFTFHFDIEILHHTQYSATYFRNVMSNITDPYFDYDEMHFYDNSWNDFRFQMASEGVNQLFSIFHFEMILIGLLMAFGIALTILAFHEENKYFNGILLSRGFGQQGLLKLILSEIWVMFMISLLVGLISGIVFGYIYLAGKRIFHPELSNLRFLFFMSPVTLFGIISLIVVLSFGIFYLTYKINSKKSISRYFHKF